jgi:hypothetical protein
MQTMSDITMPSAPRSAISQIVADIRTASPPIYATVLAMAGLAIVGLALQMIDHREIIGQNVWDKPTKFFAGVAIQFGTVGWALSFFTAEERARRSIRWPALIMLAAGWLEMAYILFRASRGEASHFNDTTQLAVILYGLMGLGAITMTGIAFIYGLRLWRRRSRGLWTEAAGLGLMAGSLLGTLAGGYMSAQTSHWVGGLVRRRPAYRPFHGPSRRPTRALRRLERQPPGGLAHRCRRSNHDARPLRSGLHGCAAVPGVTACLRLALRY